MLQGSGWPANPEELDAITSATRSKVPGCPQSPASSAGHVTGATRFPIPGCPWAGKGCFESTVGCPVETETASGSKIGIIQLKLPSCPQSPVHSSVYSTGATNTVLPDCRWDGDGCPVSSAGSIVRMGNWLIPTSDCPSRYNELDALQCLQFYTRMLGVTMTPYILFMLEAFAAAWAFEAPQDCPANTHVMISCLLCSVLISTVLAVTFLCIFPHPSIPQINTIQK